MTKSDTPRTDALMERLEREAKPYNYRWHDWADLARSLERELNAALTPPPEGTAIALLRDARPFITGELKLQCRPTETDRECMTRCKAELLDRIDVLTRIDALCPPQRDDA